VSVIVSLLKAGTFVLTEKFEQALASDKLSILSLAVIFQEKSQVVKVTVLLVVAILSIT
jgi:hypothetical protein